MKKERKAVNCSIVENDIEQRAMDLQCAFEAAGIVNKTQPSKSIHEEANTRTSCSNHLGQRLLANPWDHSFGGAVLAKMGKQ